MNIRQNLTNNKMHTQANFTAPVRIVKNFIRQNKANMTSKSVKKTSIVSKVENKNEPSKNAANADYKTKSTVSEIKPVRMNLKPDESKMVKFAALSPNVFRKTAFSTKALQREIEIPKLDMRRPSMRFDPAYHRKLPVYLDIPDLYATKKRAVKDPNSLSHGVAKLEGENGEKGRYVFVPRPRTPKKYQPQPESSHRYVRVANQRYVYEPRPPTPKNYKPRPKSGNIYAKRYSFPTARKSVFRFIGRYQYEARPPSPKNYLPRPKSSNRYLCKTDKSCNGIGKVSDGSLSYQRPKSGNRYVKRYTYPAPKRTIFKYIGRYKYEKQQRNSQRPRSGGKQINRYEYTANKRYMFMSRPETPKNYKPKPKSGIRYTKRYTYPTSRKTIVKFIGRYQYAPRPETAKNYLPRPKSSNRYVCLTQDKEDTLVKIEPTVYQRKSVFKPKGKYVYKERPKSARNLNPRPKSSKRYILKETEATEKKEANKLENNEKQKIDILVVPAGNIQYFLSVG